MTLKFSRVANNHANNGFYPTDLDTLTFIAKRLKPKNQTSKVSKIRGVDPCCGEGVALKFLADHLQNETVDIETFGIEYHLNRAQNAKQRLDTCLHANFEDCFVESEVFSVMLLNPPYGDSFHRNHHKAQRLETQFLNQSFHLLKKEGVLVLIVPVNSYRDDQLCRTLAKHFNDIKVWIAPDQTFKQTVLMAYRTKEKHPDEIADLTQALSAIPDTTGLMPESLCFDQVQWKQWKKINQSSVLGSSSLGEASLWSSYQPQEVSEVVYEVPSLKKQVRYYKINMDADNLRAALVPWKASDQRPKLPSWHTTYRECEPPLMPMTQWHVALSIASGQMNGAFEVEGLTLLFKGQTFKEQKKHESSETIQTPEGVTIKETIESRDVFKAHIKAIVFGGEHHGSIVDFQ